MRASKACRTHFQHFAFAVAQDAQRRADLFFQQLAAGRIDRAKQDVLTRAGALRVELEAHSDALWPVVFNAERRR